MALNLDQFSSELRQTGTHPKNRFRVLIDAPEKLYRKSFLKSIIDGDTLTIENTVEQLFTPKPFDERKISLRASSTIFPGKTIMVKDDLLRYGFGVVDKIGHNTLYSNVPVEFIVDSEFDLARSFHSWMDLINKADRTVDNPYLIGYKDDYATTMSISQYNRQGFQTSQCTLYDAFPIEIGDVQIAYDDMDSYFVLPVLFTYTDYTME